MNKFQRDNLSEFLNRTGNLLIHLLDKCNLACEHCYLNASKDGKNELPLAIVLRTLEEADDLGIRSVQLTGGEPLLYFHIRQVLRFTKGKNFNITLSTNAMLIDDDFAKLLAEVNAIVVVSIDGPACYHDKFRGKSGSFKKAENGISRLIDFGVPVKIVTTVCADNFNYINWCTDWAHRIKAASIQFQPLENIGRGKRIENKRLDEERLHDLFICLNDLISIYSSKDFQIKMSYKSRAFMINHPCSAFVCNGKNCHRGVEKELKKIVIREDGTILPELVNIDRRFSIGNLYNNTLKNHLLNYIHVGYSQFDQFCRKVYADTVIGNTSPLISWNEILTERSRTYTQSNLKTPVKT